MNRVEAHAADAITDSRLRVKVPAPWVFRALGKKTVEVPVPFPTGQTLARMARLFCRMDIELKELKAGDMGTRMHRPQRGDGLAHHRLRHGSRDTGLLPAEPPARLVSPVLHGHEDDGRAGSHPRAAEFAGGFYQYYRLGSYAEPDGTDDTDGEPDRERELTEEYDPPHSPFGRIYALVSSGAFTYDEVMNRIPWCVVLAMTADQGRMRKIVQKQKTMTEEEELAFFGLN